MQASVAAIAVGYSRVMRTRLKAGIWLGMGQTAEIEMIERSCDQNTDPALHLRAWQWSPPSQWLFLHGVHRQSSFNECFLLVTLQGEDARDLTTQVEATSGRWRMELGDTAL
jgi:hypothetical protein